MIISHEHRFVFMHNPKAAGSAVRMALADLHDHPTKLWHQGYLTELDRVVDLAHLTCHDLNVMFGMELAAYEFMTVVRDPYERFLSGVAEYQRQHGIDELTLDEWIECHMDETNFRFNWMYIHLCPQHYFVPASEYGVHVIRHEAMATEWDNFVLSLRPQIRNKVQPLPKVRVRPDFQRLDTVDKLTPFAISEINRVYHMDFRRFGYPMRGTKNPQPTTHYERVNSIHSPYFGLVDPNRLTDGEMVAYLQQQKKGRA